MNYAQTVEYMTKALPMYHRVGAAAYKADIKNTVQLMSLLGNPEKKFKTIHVAGTNGKGSVAHTLASILQEAGYKVGLYTSPHLVDFRERIRVNGEMIIRGNVVDFVQNYRCAIEGIGLSFFEMTVGLAFDYFAKQNVDVAVVEVGMGGRLDSTNVVTPDLSVITNIGLDHTQFLGDTLTKIASEKAGIIKEEVPVVIGETHPDTAGVFEAKAMQLGAPIDFADKRYKIVPTSDNGSVMTFDVYKLGQRLYSNLEFPLTGSYQIKNLATVFQSLEILRILGYNISDENIADGLANVVKNTGFKGRWQVVHKKPLTICETAHNADGINAMLAKLKSMEYERLRIVYGCVNDKDYGAILRMLPHDAEYYFTKPSVERGLAVETLAEEAAAAGLSGKSYPDVALAVKAATAEASAKDLILITGSIFLVADYLAGQH
ncbi:MAG: bifunctional folylpolyglutamate synthase/dihydrofolate synthase [Bacteroidaceae bacterium]|nr:bifunctional folylpolyglutamate synthase/dihydrofolate synthase [Bacteroidaceae bacterium]